MFNTFLEASYLSRWSGEDLVPGLNTVLLLVTKSGVEYGGIKQ